MSPEIQAAVKEYSDALAEQEVARDNMTAAREAYDESTELFNVARQRIRNAQNKLHAAIAADENV